MQLNDLISKLRSIGNLDTNVVLEINGEFHIINTVYLHITKGTVTLVIEANPQSDKS